MVAVAIIGILASTAAISMSTEPDVEDEANRIAAMVNETSRLAISGSTVNLEQSISGFKARAQLRVLNSGTEQHIVIERLDDSTAAFTPIERKRLNMGPRIRVVGFSPAAVTDSGQVPMAPFIPPGGAVVTCQPNGTCSTGIIEPPSGCTLYLQDLQRPTRQARVVVLPLNGMMTQVFSGW
jgi:type II secretory pathway pseudopilin PulG